MDPIDLPSNLISIFKAESFPLQQHRWNTNEEIASILISFEKHEEWLSKEVQNRFVYLLFKKLIFIIP